MTSVCLKRADVLPNVGDNFDDTLTEYAIPENVEEIGYFCFGGAIALKKVTPTSRDGKKNKSALKKIGQEAFLRCDSLSTFHFTENLEEISPWAFSESALTEVKFTKGLRKIGMGAFENIRVLTHVELNEGLEELGMGVFVKCFALKTISVPIYKIKRFDCFALKAGDVSRRVFGYWFRGRWGYKDAYPIRGVDIFRSATRDVLLPRSDTDRMLREIRKLRQEVGRLTEKLLTDCAEDRAPEKATSVDQKTGKRVVVGAVVLEQKRAFFRGRVESVHSDGTLLNVRLENDGPVADSAEEREPKKMKRRARDGISIQRTEEGGGGGKRMKRRVG
eukprot:g4999.t1